MLAFVGLFSFPAAAHAQSPGVTPNFNTLAPCPTCANPSEPVISTGVTPPDYAPGTNPAISTTPCANQDAAVSDNARHSKHKKHSGAISDFMTEILKFFLKFINMLLQLLGGGKIDSPSSGQPAISAVPSATEPENPSQAMEQPSEAQPAASQAPCPSQGQDQPENSPAPNPSGMETVPSISGPAASSSPGVSPSGAAQSAIDLSNWELTLPTGPAENPTDIFMPQLASFTADPWYIKNPDGSLKFRAAVNGVTTSGSDYPRSELREMNGTAKASWSPSSGTNTMTIEEAINAVPKTKKHVVAGQIHDASSDVIVIRLEMPKLFIKIGDTSGPTLDANYTLGKKFTVKFEATGGKTNIYYNGATTPAYSMTQSYSSAYFKAGAYTQSNCTKEASTDCNDTNYGEVTIYSLKVTHQ